VFRLNDDKVVDWLEAKVRRVQAALDTAGDVSSLIEAVGIICDYCDEKWTPPLLARLGLAADVLDPPKPTIIAEPEKKVALVKSRSAAATTSSRKPKRIKADTSSMRPLRSYFAAKS
jgi:hypothetical protein